VGNLLSKLFGTARKPSPPDGSDASAGIGMFTGIPLPQDPRNTLVKAILPTMSGDAGLRLSASTNRAGRYFGTDGMPPLRFPLSGEPKVNRPVDLEQAAFKPN
jgi:hypothetical protein